MGGRSASRSVDKRAASIGWAATLTYPTSSGFFRDGRALAG